MSKHRRLRTKRKLIKKLDNLRVQSETRHASTRVAPLLGKEERLRQATNKLAPTHETYVNQHDKAQMEVLRAKANFDALKKSFGDKAAAKLLAQAEKACA